MVNNASRYGKPPIHIGIHIETSKDNGADVLVLPKYLMIAVSDEGEGVAEDQLERIMQPFERGETARTTQGSGLGLAIVSRITHLHNGTVIARNQVTQGGLEVLIKIPIID